MLSDHGANNPVDRVENMSFSYDFYATLYFNRFSHQPTGKPSDYDPNYDIHETLLGNDANGLADRAGGDLVGGRISDLKGLRLGSPFNHPRQGL